MVTATPATGVVAGWHLACPVCGYTCEPTSAPFGCPACAERGETETLAVVRDTLGELPSATRTERGIWKYDGLLPRVPSEFQLTLGEGDTPLVRLPFLAELTGCDRLYLKLEMCNPTASHKDRFHAVSLAVGRALGFDRVVSASTGNHGFSMTSYAAAHGMRAVVIANQRMPDLLQRAIRFAGGLPLVAPPSIAGALLTELVKDDGWFPSTVSWPLPVANPFGTEGYKTVGFELYGALGNRMPDAVFIPAAAGDGVVGLEQSVADMRRLGLANVETRLCPVQPATAAPMVSALDANLERVAEFPGANSIALSIADPVSGDRALRAVRDSDGFGVVVDDREILEIGKRLARHGLLVEPSSAASVAGAIKAISERPQLANQTLVCVITSSGLKWLDDYAGIDSLPAGVAVGSVIEARRTIESFVGQNQGAA